MSYTYEQLRRISDNELIKQHDACAKNTGAGVSYYLEELSRRDANRINESMLKYTKWVTAMTAVMLLATIANICIAVFH